MINLDEMLKQGIEMQFLGKNFTLLQPTVEIVKKLSELEENLIRINQQILDYQQGKTKTEVKQDKLFDIRCEITKLLLNNNEENIKFTIEDVKKLNMKLQVEIYNQVNKFVYKLENQKN